MENRTKAFFAGAIVGNQEMQTYLRRLGEHHAQTMAHSNRVGQLSVDLGFENYMSQADLFLLCYAGVLHDIGKLGIPVEILDKESSLTR